MNRARDIALIIPVENQVRELEPKLLLACLAAARGFPAIIGSRLEVDFHIASLPRGIYLSKSMTERSVKMFRIMRRLGHLITAWDEEALVHPPAETYFSRRLSPAAISEVAHLFAWGEENAALWRAYPDYPGTPIHLTGNPRGDMLRPELRAYYEADARHLRDTYGDFVLVNTNFGFVNAFNPGQNLFRPGRRGGNKSRIGRAAVGMPGEFARGLHDHKEAIFEQFQQLVPALERAFPAVTIVIRPHPVELPAVYHDIAARSQRVVVSNEGNIIPWLMAARALIHNGCTTGLEAYALGVPAIAYQPVVNEIYDDTVYRLPNRLSHQCFDFAALRDTLGRILRGTLGAAGGEERRQLLDPVLGARSGALACERIIDTLVSVVERGGQALPPAAHRFDGWQRATRRRIVKQIKGLAPGSKYHPAFQRHRYPGLQLEDMHARVARFQQLLGDSRRLQVERLRDYLFRVTPPT